MKIKISGLKDPQNIKDITLLKPDYMGFDFYKNSSRFIKQLPPAIIRNIPKRINKVGIFVNDNLENILTAIQKYNLDTVQLHGADNIALCQTIKEESKTTVIKVFPVIDSYNLRVTDEYEQVADLFLFETKTDVYNNSKQKFNWNILSDYTGNTEFILGGNIEYDDVKSLLKIKHPQMLGVDISRKFEIAPGVKNIALIRQFIDEIKRTISEQEE